jgi:hypothetical protein
MVKKKKTNRVYREWIMPKWTGGSGTSAAAYASSDAPAGYVWDFVTFGDEPVSFNGDTVVSLIKAN